MATQSLEIQFYNGRSKNAGYTYAGHGASTHNKDAVWSFVAPADRLKKLTVPFTWDNSDAGTGFQLAVDMYFSVTANGSTNSADTSQPRLAANDDPDRVQQITVPMSGSSGSVTAEFTELNLEEGTTYYIRANVADGVYSSIKGFSQTIDGATYEKYSGAYVDFDGTKRDADIRVNINGVWYEAESRLNIHDIWKESEPMLFVQGAISDGQGDVAIPAFTSVTHDGQGNVTVNSPYKVTHDGQGNVTLS